MKILAIDVGMGTQDILLYDSEKNIENCFKMVLPSQTQIVARRITKETSSKHDIVLTGETMGGGPCAAAVKRHIHEGLIVYATRRAALTLNDDIHKIEEMGVVIIAEEEVPELKASIIEMCDVDKNSLEKALQLFGLLLPDRFAVAVQDHGYSPDVSNRVFRFEYFRDVMKTGGELKSFVYKDSIPDRFSRMKAVERTLPGALLMDTGIAALRGALLEGDEGEPHLVVNIGNGHTLAGAITGRRLIALFEHHTHMMTAGKLEDYMRRLCNGELGYEEVFNDGGHGCYISESTRFENIGTILVTGPNRRMMENSGLDFIYAVPYGDMMLTGCFGLVDAYLDYCAH